MIGAQRARRELMDKLHRGFVWSMIGVTGVSLACICHIIYGFVTAAKQRERIMLAELTEGEDPEEFPKNRSHSQLH